MPTSPLTKPVYFTGFRQGPMPAVKIAGVIGYLYGNMNHQGAALKGGAYIVAPRGADISHIQDVEWKTSSPQSLMGKALMAISPEGGLSDKMEVMVMFVEIMLPNGGSALIIRRADSKRGDLASMLDREPFQPKVVPGGPHFRDDSVFTGARLPPARAAVVHRTRELDKA